MQHIENIVIGKPLVSPKEMFSNGFEEDWKKELDKTYFTNERYLPKILKEIGFTKSTSEVRRNRKDLCITLDKLDFLEIKLGKKKLWVLVGEKVKNTYIEADTEKVKQAIDKCTKKYGELLRKLGSE